jgi:pyruvate formate-lyase/glycerol dehydratase family glycyl radical enzyme
MKDKILSERITKLKDEVVSIKPKICIERARLVTESYKETEPLPMVIRRARALEKILLNMSIYISDGELIVGNQASRPRSAPIFPEYSWDWIVEEIDSYDKRPSDKFEISEDDKKRLLELLKFWKGKTVKDRVLATQTKDVLRDKEVGVLGWEGNVTAGQGHIVVDYEMVLKNGFKGVIKKSQEKLKSLNLTDPEDLRKRPFLKAVSIVFHSGIRFGKRYAKLAQKLASEETEPMRKKELESIAKICDCIPENPPRNFKEAMQMVWFVQLILQIESNGHSVSLGRFDQYMYPYYRRDMEAGTLTKEEALELIECFYIKLFSVNKIRPWSHTRFVSGYPTYQNLIVGGQTEDGRDATNELSYLCLDALADVRLSEPNFYVRYHDNMPEDFLRKCIDVIKIGFGMPALVNDKVIIPSLMNRGVTLEDAMNYSTMGCLEVQVPGKWGYRSNGKSKFNLLKILELALNNGLDPRTGIQLCEGEGNLADFKSFDDVMKAWEKQLKFFMALQVTADNINDLAIEELAPDVFCSALVHDCLDRGKTLMEGGAVYDIMSGCQVGVANVGNSLSAIKELVFDKNIISLEELDKVLKNNFEGIEGRRVQELLINRAAKYGNDDDYVDLITKKAFDIYVNGIEKYKNTRYGRGPIGGIFTPATVTISANVPSGAIVGATPDGRKAGEPTNDGVSPVHGTEKHGPTAVVKSVTKLSTLLMTGGQLLNMRFNKTMLNSEETLEKFIALLRTFFDRYGWHVQFNMISSDVLKQARRHPDKHKDLVIRVAGYSALFVSLDPVVQGDIINRMEYQM